MPITETRLRQNEVLYIERILRDQKTHDAIIAELQAELDEMVPSCPGSILRFSHDLPQKKDSQPEEWTIIRNESVRAKELHSEIRRRKRQKDAVSLSMQSMTPEESQYIFLRYHEEQSHSRCAHALHMWNKGRHAPSRTYWSTRQRVLLKVARFVLI